MSVSSLVGVSSINNTVYPPVAVLPEYLPAVEINVITGLSSINGAVYPPAGGSGPTVLSGKVALATNGQTVVYSTAFKTSVSVVVQGTSNAAGVNGFFTVSTNGSLSQFQIFYSGQLIYGPIELFWIAVGT